MQKAIPFQIHSSAILDSKKVTRSVKALTLGVLHSLRGLIEAMVTPPPGQQRIEEIRLRAMRLTGHF